MKNIIKYLAVLVACLALPAMAAYNPGVFKAKASAPGIEAANTIEVCEGAGVTITGELLNGKIDDEKVELTITKNDRSNASGYEREVDPSSTVSFAWDTSGDGAAKWTCNLSFAGGPQAQCSVTVLSKNEWTVVDTGVPLDPSEFSVVKSVEDTINAGANLLPFVDDSDFEFDSPVDDTGTKEKKCCEDGTFAERRFWSTTGKKLYSKTWVGVGAEFIHQGQWVTIEISANAGLVLSGDISYNGTFGLKNGSCIPCDWWLDGNVTVDLKVAVGADVDLDFSVLGWGGSWSFDADVASLGVPLTIQANYNSKDDCEGLQSCAYLGELHWTFFWWASDDDSEAIDDNFNAEPGTQISGNVTANDIMPEGGGTVGLAVGPDNGTVVINGNGSFTYTPDEGFTGYDSFMYRVPEIVDEKNDGLALVFIYVAEGATDPENPGHLDPIENPNKDEEGDETMKLWATNGSQCPN